MSRPNLLFIYTDEQRYDTMAAYGNTQIEMPNLNRFCETATVFAQAYVTQPVCTPSRSTLLTGLYPHSNGCTENNRPLKPETLCLPEMLKTTDYVTAHHGKWHLGNEIFSQHGFGEWVGIDDSYHSYYSADCDQDERCGYHHFLIENGFTPKNGSRFGRGEVARFPEEFSKPAFLAQEAARFLKENKDNPFVLYVNFFEPHMPFFGPRDDQYDPDDMPIPDNYVKPDDSVHLKVRLLAEYYSRKGHSGLPLSNEAEWKRMIANYWGLCSQVDTYAGKILDSLEELGLDKNTIVVYTSDHGDMMGSHRIIAKTVQYEEAVRVPFMIRMPGQRESRRINGPVSQIDVVPTLLELMGESVPVYLEGKSRAPLLQGTGDTELAEDVFIEWNGPNNGLGDVSGNVQIPEWMKEMAPAEEIARATCDPVRTVITAEGWKFTWSTIGYHELYNLASDPQELKNVWKENPDVVRDLCSRIKVWQKKTADTAELPEI